MTMSEHLSPEQKTRLRELLSALRSALADRQRSHLDGQSRVEHAREVLQQDGDDATQRDAEREVDLAMADRDASALDEAEAALERLALGTYGLCAGCGEPIPFARLQLQPAARRCLACASAAERGQPRPPTM